MLASLLLLFFAALTLLFSFIIGWRRAFLAGALVWGLLIVALTESLSALHLFTTAGVAVGWGVAALAACVALGYSLARGKRISRLAWPVFSSTEVLILSACLFIVGVTFLVAVLAPPNNWDSMTYHMARIAHWIQDQSIAAYPTHIDRQIHATPWAEYAIAHFQLLTGGDRLANLVQWFSMVACAIGASLIAADLGATRRAQWLAALISLTVPIGILEGSNTQNDYAAAFWLLGVAHYTFDAAKRDLSWSTVAGFSVSVALALLTKGTQYFYAFPFVIALPLIGFRALRWQFIPRALAISAIVVTVNAPHLARNMSVFGNPLGSNERHTVEAVSPASLLSNMARNILMNIYLPTENGPLAHAANDAVEAFHRALGLSTGDIRTSFMGHTFRMPYFANESGLNPYAFHEDRAGNLVHTLLYLATIPVALLGIPLRRNRTLIGYLVLVVGGFVLFCLFIKWQIFASRFQLTPLTLMAPFAAIVFAAVTPRKADVALIALLVVQALPFTLINYSRPALPSFVRTLTHGRNIYSDRIDQMFTNRPDTQTAYEEAAQYLVETGCTQIGLVNVTVESSWEYPLWVLMLEHYDYGDFRIEHVLVHNQTGKIAEQPAFRDFQPCALALLDESVSDLVWNAIGDGYSLGYTSESISIFVPE